MDEAEVTNEEYTGFLNAAGQTEPGWLDLASRQCKIKKTDAGFTTDAPRLPVVTVTFAGAEAFCRWKSKKTGWLCRLPTESEWEKAARGPESYVYAYGNVYEPDEANQESGRLLPVQSFSPNGFGLYDMTGNAFEWVAGRYAWSPADPPNPYTHVLRGGSFVLDGMYLRNSFRMRQSPTVMTDDIGFRAVYENPPLREQ
jgi:formylglycine-generating enzyme required for sulfatase activity